MKSSKVSLFILTFLLASQPHSALSDTGEPRPLFGSSLTNGVGILYVPSSTPLGNRACYFDSNSAPASSVTTATELTYVHGVTSSIQAQINAITGGLVATPAIGNIVSAPFTVPTLTNNYFLNVNTASGNINIVFPNASASAGFCLDVKNTGGNMVINNASGGATIDGQTTNSITDQNDSTHYCAVGGNWFIY